MLIKSIVESIDHEDWFVKGWQIKFLLSEKLLHQIGKLSRVDNWYEDPIVVATGMDRLGICFNSIYEYFDTFGVLPQIGDRLFNEDSGLVVQDRSIDGGLKTITYTLGL